jgi:hypothetical protein
MARTYCAAAALAGLLVAASAAAVDAAPVAAPAIAGYGELGGGWTRLQAASGFSVDSLPTYAIGGVVNLPVANAWNLELEGRTFQVDPAATFSAFDTGAFAHFYYRDPMRYALGGFAGHTDLNLYGMTGSMWTAGGEAQAYLGQLTLYGQAAAFNSTTSSGWLYFTGYFARGTARYFATPNLRLEFDAQWAHLDNSDHTDALTLIGTAEYRFSGSPFSAFATARFDQLDPALNQTYKTQTYLVGLRAYFGSGTLLDNDRRGAPMDVLPFPPLYALNFG